MSNLSETTCIDKPILCANSSFNVEGGEEGWQLEVGPNPPPLSWVRVHHRCAGEGAHHWSGAVASTDTTIVHEEPREVLFRDAGNRILPWLETGLKFNSCSNCISSALSHPHVSRHNGTGSCQWERTNTSMHQRMLQRQMAPRPYA